MPNYDDDYCKDHNANIELELKYLKELEEVQILIDKLDFENSLTVDKFVQYDKSEIICKIIFNKKLLKQFISIIKKIKKRK